MSDARPLTLYAVVRKIRRGEMIISDTISRTRSAARRIYTDFYVDDYKRKLAQEFRSGQLRVAAVTVTVTKPQPCPQPPPTTTDRDTLYRWRAAMEDWDNGGERSVAEIDAAINKIEANHG